MEFIISHTDEVLVSHSGLALAGAVLQQSPLRKRLNDICLGERKRPEVKHGDVLVSMIGLLCLGKSDYADIETYRQEEFFRRALGCAKLPSEETLRQRMDDLGTLPIGGADKGSGILVPARINIPDTLSAPHPSLDSVRFRPCPESVPNSAFAILTSSKPSTVHRAQHVQLQ